MPVSLTHLFVHCQNLKCIWNFIDSKVKILFKDNVSVDDKTIILGSSIMLNEKENLQVWLIITITKMFIYNMRIKQNNPTIKSLKI